MTWLEAMAPPAGSYLESTHPLVFRIDNDSANTWVEDSEALDRQKLNRFVSGEGARCRKKHDLALFDTWSSALVTHEQLGRIVRQAASRKFQGATWRVIDRWHSEGQSNLSDPSRTRAFVAQARHLLKLAIINVEPSDFESGLENSLTMAIRGLIEAFAFFAVDAIVAELDDGQIPEGIQIEILKQLGRQNQAITRRKCEEVLKNALSSGSPLIRDAAIVALSCNLTDVTAKMLEEHLEDETFDLLRADIVEILREFHALASA